MQMVGLMDSSDCSGNEPCNWTARSCNGRSTLLLVSAMTVSSPRYGYKVSERYMLFLLVATTVADTAITEVR